LTDGPIEKETAIKLTYRRLIWLTGWTET
jgi:hypothetical protein